jgi:anti-anti-sigma factor
MINMEEKNDHLLCSFSGKLDTYDCKQWEENYREMMQKKDSSVVFDLKGIDFVSSLFLKICLQTAKEVTVEKFSITNVSPMVKKVFKIAGLDTQLKIQ